MELEMSGLLHSVHEHTVFWKCTVCTGVAKKTKNKQKQAKTAPASPAADVIASLMNTLMNFNKARVSTTVNY